MFLLQAPSILLGALSIPLDQEMSRVTQAQLSILCTSLVGALIKSTSASASEIGVARLVVALLVVLAITKCQDEQLLPFFPRSTNLKNRSIAVMIGLLFGGHWFLFFLAFQYAQVSTVTFALLLYPIFLTVFAHIFFGERIRRKEIPSLIVCLVGGVVLLPSFSLGTGETIGFLLSSTSSVMFAFVALLHKLSHRFLSDNKRSLAQYSFALPLFLACLPKAPFSLLMPLDWGILLILGVVCTGIGHTLWARANVHLPATSNALIFLLGPVYASLWAWLILGEIPSAKLVIGAMLVITGNIWNLSCRT